MTSPVGGPISTTRAVKSSSDTGSEASGVLVAAGASVESGASVDSGSSVADGASVAGGGAADVSALSPSLLHPATTSDTAAIPHTHAR